MEMKVSGSNDSVESRAQASGLDKQSAAALAEDEQKKAIGKTLALQIKIQLGARLPFRQGEGSGFFVEKGAVLPEVIPTQRFVRSIHSDRACSQR